jgi:UDP-4-amino-4-deoxy-L-arabinose formyltransferase/UDP-glucuronic acid dehydrogenase (UDP-4-keto-hexauronic acid decarboxylating)
MRVAAIGRTEIMYKTIELLLEQGYEVPLIITSKEAPEYSKTAEDFKNLANSIGAIYIYTPQINTKEIIDRIKEIEKIDICVSINYSGIISQNVIDLFKQGILNAHAGDLPRYRGNACQAWAIINGENKMGLCIYKMKGDYLDGGELIAKKYYPIHINTTITDIWNDLNNDIPELFLNAVNKLKAEPTFFIEDTTKSNTKPMRCYPRIPDDSKIDWKETNIQILRIINSSTAPFSGAFGNFNDKKIIIWKAELFEDDEDYLAIPGQISNIRADNFIEVITGKGKLLIKEIEYEGIRTNKPSEIIKSIRNRFT